MIYLKPDSGELLKKKNNYILKKYNTSSYKSC